MKALGEAKGLLALSMPMVAGQVLQMSMGFIDTAMVGVLGAQATAAVGLSSAIVGVVLIFGFGLCVPIQVFTAAAHAMDDRAECSRVLFHGTALLLAFSLILGAAATPALKLLEHIGQAPEVVAQAQPFLFWILWSAAPALMGAGLRNYAEARQRQWLPLASVALMLPLNVFLNWLLIYGNWGFPEMGVEGAGLASFVARWFQFLALAFCVWRQPQIRPVLKEARHWSGEWIKRMLAVGIPCALQILSESGVFSIMALLAGSISVVAQAAMQITLTVGGMSFTVVLALAFSTTILAGRAFARKDGQTLRRIRNAGLGLSTAFMLCYMVFVLVLRNEIPRWFTQDAEVIAHSKEFLFWAACFAVFDGAHVICVGWLRGAQDVKTPSLITALSYWLITLPFACLMAFACGFRGEGLWMGLTLGMVLVALYAYLRVAWNLRRFKEGNFWSAPPSGGRALKN